MKTIIFILLINILCVTTLKAETPIEVTVDKRIELVRIIWTQAFEKKLPKDLKPIPSFYHQEASRYFKNGKNHPAVQIMQEHSMMDYSLPKIGAFMDDSYSVEDSTELNNWNERFGKEVMDSLLFAIKDFAKKYSFDSFYKKKQELYKEMVLDFEKQINEATWLNDVCRIFDCRDLEKIIIYFEPLNNCGNYELGRKTPKEGIIEIGLAYLADDVEQAKSQKDKPVVLKFEDWIKRVFYHELCHYFTTKNTKSLSNLFSQYYASFYNKKDAYTKAEWSNQIDESFVRAYVAYIYSIAENTNKGTEEINLQMEQYPQVKSIFFMIRNNRPSNGIMDNKAQMKVLSGLLAKIKAKKVKNP